MGNEPACKLRSQKGPENGEIQVHVARATDLFAL